MPKWRIQKSKYRPGYWEYFRINTGDNQIIGFALSWREALNALHD